MVPPINDDSLMPFGKYKGFKMANVPGGYLRWLYDNATQLRPDLKAYLETNLHVIDHEIKLDKKAQRH